MAETSTIFGFMKYVSATDILSDFKKTVDSHFVNSLNSHNCGYNNINPIPTITPVINRMEMVLKMSFFLAS